MSLSSIPEKTRYILWGKAAGRCQYRGCNEKLYLDSTTQTEFNIAYIAHIVADSPKGPRGDVVRSPLLAKKISNLMLLCDEHHRLIDREKVNEHPESLLVEMKEEHERRIELQTSILGEMQSHLLLYGANTGQHSPGLSWEETAKALLPYRYPADSRPITIGLKNSAKDDSDPEYWKSEVENLRAQFNNRVKIPLNDGFINHLSVFALAPQPLLIELGVLLGDINESEAFQKKRDPSTWEWLPDAQTEHQIIRPSSKAKTVALKLELSAKIEDERITSALPGDVAIWSITHDSPGNDYLKSKSQLQNFRETVRKAFADIKLTHGEDAFLHIFPASPISTCIELGRAWMPKADLSFHIYEQNTSKGGFYKAHTIKNSKEQ